MDFIQRDPPDDKRCALGAAVSAGIHQHRDKRHKKRHNGNCILIPRQEGPCQRCGKHQHQQPDDPVLGVLDHRGIKVGLLTWIHGSHLRNILRSLIHSDIPGVVYRHDAHHPLFHIQNRYGEKIVSGKQSGNRLLVRMSVNRDNIRLHQLLHRPVVIHCHQVFCRHNSRQFPVIKHIAGVNRLFMNSRFLNMCQGLGYRIVLPQIHIFGCHYASGAVLRIV